jgi:hypothetical protein
MNNECNSQIDDCEWSSSEQGTIPIVDGPTTMDNGQSTMAEGVSRTAHFY